MFGECSDGPLGTSARRASSVSASFAGAASRASAKRCRVGPPASRASRSGSTSWGCSRAAGLGLARSGPGASWPGCASSSSTGRVRAACLTASRTCDESQRCSRSRSTSELTTTPPVGLRSHTVRSAAAAAQHVELNERRQVAAGAYPRAHVTAAPSNSAQTCWSTRATRSRTTSGSSAR
jgi:hypothetical protein